MKQLLKEFIKNTPLFFPVRNWVNARRQQKEFVEWERLGRPMPPPHLVKQETIRSFAKQFEIKILVETGTYQGDMVEAMKAYFSQIYSIELSKALYDQARIRFSNAKNVRIIQGDSGVELGKLASMLTEPALFWLDGHYSAGFTARGDKDTPIYEELSHIFKANPSKDVIIIDDARCFGSDPAYPSIEELSDFIKKNRPNANIEVKDDSIRITPSKIDT